MWRSPWQKVISRSEKIVGYPSSFINIRYLISDELATVASQVRRLVGTRHPLLKTARSLIGDSRGVAQIRGLIILLVSKTFSHASPSINSQQRSLSEIMETAHAAISIHRGLVNVDESDGKESLTYKSEMQFGNKMATLCGDYLLASVSQALAELRNTGVVDTISQGIGDCIESAFVTKDIHNSMTYRNFVYLSNGSLFSRCCRAAVTLRTNVSDDELEDSVRDETIAENWAVRWSELYALCEDINIIVQQLSDGKVKSKILQSKHSKPYDIGVLSSDLEVCSSLLSATHGHLESAYKPIPHHNKQAKEILEEMSTLLYQDALSNINICL